MIVAYLKQHPFFRRFFLQEQDEAQPRGIFSRGQDEAHDLFLELSTQTQISGLSFFERQIHIAKIPSLKEVQRFHNSLSTRVDDFIIAAQKRYPTMRAMHEISKSDAMHTSSMVYAAKIFSYISDMSSMAYLVYGVFFYQKLPNSNYWKLLEEPQKTSWGDVDLRYTPPLYSSYPETMGFSFCGACGDVNYLQQRDMNFFTEKFYSDSSDSNTSSIVSNS